VMMPDINGFEVCKLIKSNPAFVDIPVIFLTVLDTNAARHQGLDAGGIDFVTKPVDLDLLNLRVRNHLVMKEHRDLLEQKNEELEAALARVKQLEGIIPICMHCKKIRDDKEESWQQLETYISKNSEALFSHGICPECHEKQMKDLAEMR
jgi:response regulator RpfG family c-di-GMP phosphodiesterase